MNHSCGHIDTDVEDDGGFDCGANSATTVPFNFTGELDNHKVDAADSNDEGDDVGGSDVNVDADERMDTASEALFNALYDATIQKSQDKNGLTKQYSDFVRSRIVDGYGQAAAKAEANDLLRVFF